MHLSEPADKRAYMCASLLKRFALLYRSCILKRVEFDAITGGKRVIYIGDGESLGYIREMLAGGGRESSGTRIPLWRLAGSLRMPAGSGVLLCLEINRLLRCLVPAGGVATYPWIRQRIMLSSGECAARKGKIEHNYGRKVRKYGYQFRLATDRESVSRYYAELHLPHIGRRYNDPHVRSFAETLKAVKGGFLIQVLAGDLWVAGAACRVGRDDISVINFGHVPDEIYPLRFGALSAVYYFLVDYARHNSISSLDLLRSRPHADDGVYRHKKFWGAVPEVDHWPHTMLSINVDNASSPPRGMEGLLVWEEGEFITLGEILERRRSGQGATTPEILS